MTDRELLEAAAKAARLPDGSIYVGERGFLVPTGDDFQSHIWWNPLASDADALRLSVTTGEPFVVRARCVTTMGGLIEDFNPDVKGDDLRATRRVIVRAASEMAPTSPPP